MKVISPIMGKRDQCPGSRIRGVFVWIMCCLLPLGRNGPKKEDGVGDGSVCERSVNDGVLPYERARYTGVPFHTSSRHNHALQCPSPLPAAPAVMVMMSPVPRTVPIIPVVPRSHDDRRGVYNGRRWDDDHGCGSDDHGCGSDEDRQRQPNRDMDPSVSWERQGKTCKTQEHTQTHYP